LESESFNAGYGKASECIGKVVAALPAGVAAYCKGGVMAHLVTGYAVVREQKGAETADKWLAETLQEAAGDIREVAGVGFQIVVARKE
jgi:hypothetical protein